VTVRIIGRASSTLFLSYEKIPRLYITPAPTTRPRRTLAGDERSLPYPLPVHTDHDLAERRAGLRGVGQIFEHPDLTPDLGVPVYEALDALFRHEATLSPRR
jgi:hypothetical protein